MFGFALDVAFTVTRPTTEGAVKVPSVRMLPPPATTVQATIWSVSPMTMAVKRWLAPLKIAE